MNKRTPLRALTEGAIMVAIAQILSYIKLWEMPWGGSIVLAMVPIILYAVRWGLVEGLLAGFAFSVLQFAFDGGFAIGWQSILGDYLLAYTVLGLAGLFSARNQERIDNQTPPTTYDAAIGKWAKLAGTFVLFIGGIIAILYSLITYSDDTSQVLLGYNYQPPLTNHEKVVILIGALGIIAILIGIALLIEKSMVSRKNNVFAGTLIGGCARFLVHYVVGATVWAEYMPEEFFGMSMHSPWFYSLLYNLAYMLPNIVITLVVFALLWKPMGKYLRGDDLK